ncbi:uncharacterized protein LOC121303134 [Polyodon spathula]|uniref:uncharacterized protein LOC121303134 n=1 Tax=Polyodon spathula TaxID=7913 RepID=UPI001B7DE173|nr:uncharacterized protein LOC121303134 [Polyodon spathula]
MNLYKSTSSLCLVLTGLLGMSASQKITFSGIPGRFFFVELNYTWGAARQHCKTSYLDLAELPPAVTDPKMKWTKAWIGLSRSVDSLDWLWVSGKTANITEAGLAKDEEYYPDCMALTSLGKWEKTVCAERNSFICTDNETTTPAVSSRLSFIELNYTWGRARQHCQTIGLDLAELPPAVTDPKMKWTKAWIGLSRSVDSLDWLWVSGKTANITEAGLAKDEEYYPDCMALTSLGKWEKTVCAERNSFICTDNARSTLQPMTDQNYSGNYSSNANVGGVTADPKAVANQTKGMNGNGTQDGGAGGKTVAPIQGAVASMTNTTSNATVLNLLNKATCVASPATGLLTVAVVFTSSVVQFS